MDCPNCKSHSILIIDVNVPPNLFECMDCNKRFHTIGFEPSQIDAKVSLDGLAQLTHGLLLGR
jgi:transcriptional regulator NrdR family protein